MDSIKLSHCGHCSSYYYVLASCMSRTDKDKDKGKDKDKDKDKTYFGHCSSYSYMLDMMWGKTDKDKDKDTNKDNDKNIVANWPLVKLFLHTCKLRE